MILKSLLRVLTLSALGLGVLYLMTHYNLLDLASIQHAFQKGFIWVVVVVLTQILLAILMMLRYRLVLRSVGIIATNTQVLSASFVSNGLGQWAPGAIAVTEMIRVGLILGSDAKTESKLRVAMASLIDRLVGFFVILLLGGITSLCLFAQQYIQLEKMGTAQWALLLLGLVSFSTGVGIGVLPKVSQWQIFHLMFDRFKTVARYQKEIAHCLSEPRRLLVPVAMSFVCFFVSSLGMYVASLAAGSSIPLLVTFATFPVIAVSSLLPIGFGGLGGYQLVAVAVFGILGVPSASVSSASLLQNAIALAVNTFLGFIQLHNSGTQVKKILAKVASR